LYRDRRTWQDEAPQTRSVPNSLIGSPAWSFLELRQHVVGSRMVVEARRETLGPSVAGPPGLRLFGAVSDGDPNGGVGDKMRRWF
jgi:hypothetical protein